MGYFNKNNMHGNTNKTYRTMIKYKSKNTYVPRLFDKPSLFTENKLRETPI